MGGSHNRINWTRALYGEAVFAISNVEYLRLAIFFQLVVADIAHHAHYRGPRHFRKIAHADAHLASKRIATLIKLVDETLVHDHYRHFRVHIGGFEIATAQQRCAEGFSIIRRYCAAFQHLLGLSEASNVSECN